MERLDRFCKIIAVERRREHLSKLIADESERFECLCHLGLAARSLSTARNGGAHEESLRPSKLDATARQSRRRSERLCFFSNSAWFGPSKRTTQHRPAERKSLALGRLQHAALAMAEEANPAPAFSGRRDSVAPPEMRGRRDSVRPSFASRLPRLRCAWRPRWFSRYGRRVSRQPPRWPPQLGGLHKQHK